MKRFGRDFLLTLIISALVFAATAFFLVGIAEGLMGDVVNNVLASGGEAGQTGTTEILGTGEISGGISGAVSGDQKATFLLVGLDQKSIQADAIFLVGINATKKEATVALIPSDTRVSDGGSIVTLAQLYPKRGADAFRQAIVKETGVSVDFYAAMSMVALENIIDFIGGIQYTVPENMFYFDSSQNLRINLKEGPQLLSGYEAVGLVSYRSYQTGNGFQKREDTQIDFVRAFCSAFLKKENLPRAKTLLYNIYYNLQTDFKQNDWNEMGDMIFSFGEYSQSFLRIPGERGNGGYTVSSSLAQAMFQSYQ